MADLGVNRSRRILGILVALFAMILLVTEGITVCIRGNCVVAPTLMSLSKLFKFSILLLTVIGFVFSYENWTSPKTSLMPEKTRRTWDRETGDYGVVLRNGGTSDATIRVLVRVDGEKPYPDQADAANCLYARIPHSSPFPGGDPYPKRSRIARDDFRAYKNVKEWSSDVGEMYSYVVETTPNSLPSLPIDGENHEVHFEVQQTGEHYVYTYESNGETITSIDRDTVGEIKKELGEG